MSSSAALMTALMQVILLHNTMEYDQVSIICSFYVCGVTFRMS
jgi:hypothetical protein